MTLAHAVILAAMTGVLCPRAGAVEGVDRPEVVIDDFRMEPLANFITENGIHEFHPKGLLGLGYDSNVYATEDAIGDGFVRGIAGIEGRINSTLFDLIVYDLELESKIYFQESDRNLLGGRFDGEWVREGMESTTSTGVHWARIDDPLIETGENIQRSEYYGNVVHERERANGSWNAGLDLGRNQFDEDGRTFTAEERSNWFGLLNGGWIWQFSETGDTSVNGTVGYRTYDLDTRFQDNWVVGATAGWRGRIGDRTFLNASAGLEARMYADDFVHNPAWDDKLVLVPVGVVLGRWQYREFSRVDLQFYSRATDSTSANAAWIYGTVFDWLHAFDERWRAGAFGTWYTVRDSGSNTGEPIRTRETWQIGAKAELEMVRGIGGRFRVSYASSDSNVDEDFDRLEAVIEMGIVF
ncbi:MAG: hypothetical protein PF961_05505 [Planctomycetota bacterium]|nr:hypothetical protein [Planctomycetota bacterium]